MADRTIWTGHCEPEAEDASLYLHAADLCVLPFDGGVRLNNSSIAVAATHALPIITTQGDMLEAPFLDGENVRLCPPNDPRAMSAVIMELIDNPAMRDHLRAGAAQLAASQFSWDRVIDSTTAVLGSGGISSVPGQE